MTEQICKELGIKQEELHRYPTLQQLIKEYEEIKVFQKVLQRMLGVDRLIQISLRADSIPAQGKTQTETDELTD